MPKVQVKRKPPRIDMTAMTDVAFLLLTFFMLTTKFKPEEPFMVDTPSSVSDIKLPESDIMQISVDKDGKVYFGIDGKNVRAETLKKMGTQYNISFTPQEIAQFSLIETFGVPVNQMKQFLALSPEQRGKIKEPGIPSDTTDNQLRDWIWYGRLSNPKVRVAIKGDSNADYPIIKQIIATLQERKVNKFNLITSLETGEQ